MNSSAQYLANNLLIQTEESGISSFLQWFTREPHDQWLLVLDDLSLDSFPEHQRKSLVDFLSNFDRKCGEIIITTTLDAQLIVHTSDDDSPQPHIIEVSPLSEPESKKMLNASSKSVLPALTKEAQAVILGIAEGLPSRIQFLVAFWQNIKESSEPKQTWEIFEKKVRGQSSDHALGEAFSMALDQVKLESIESYDILCFATHLDIQGIPDVLLTAIWHESHSSLTLRVRRCLRKLVSFSLISWSPETNRSFMAESTRSQIRKKMLQCRSVNASLQKVIQVLARLFTATPATRRTCEDLLPHVQQVSRSEIFADEDKTPRLSLLLQLGKFNMMLSMHEDARDAFQRALKVQKLISDTDDLGRLEIEEKIASVLLAQDKIEEAADLHKLIEESYQKILPSDHYRLLMHSGQYGVVFLEQGKWEEAEKRLLQGLKGAQEIYDDSDGKVLAIKNDIARLQFMRGCYEDAFQKYEELLNQYRLQYEDSNPQVFQTMSWIARVLGRLGKHQESAEMYRKAADSASASSQVSLEFILSARGNLAVALSGIGQLSKAAEEQQKIIDLYKLLEPQPSLNVIRTSLNLGITLERLSRYDESRAILEIANNGLVGAGLGNTHPTSLEVRNSLALSYLRLDEFSKAETEYYKLVDTQKALHPGEPDHPDVLLVKNNLAGSLQRQDRYIEAIAIQQEVYDCAMRIGAGSRIALMAGTNLAESFRMLAETGVENKEELLDKAEELHRAVLTEREEQFGEMWQTWVTRINIGMVLQAKGKEDEALIWYKDLDTLADVVGEKNWTVKVGRAKLKKLDSRT